ncbi:MAG TPA: hypothetical protein VLM83_02745, partial [Anaerolineales bacterium]|nr:hypothetical protein [Anaerolineales bacterium]
CNLIYAGQSLQIPITSRSYDLFDADFDCDGENERVEGSFVGDMGKWSRVQVLAIGETGFYQPAWEWRLADFDLERIHRVTLLQTESCVQYLAVQVIGSYQSYWSLFTWDGVTMQPVDVSSAELQRLLQSNRIEE